MQGVITDGFLCGLFLAPLLLGQALRPRSWA